MTRAYLIDDLDKTLALVGVILSLSLTIWIKLVIDRPIYIVIGILCFTVFTAYLIIRRFFDPLSIPYLEALRCSTQFNIILNILFFLLFSYSIITIYLRPFPYIRPLGYFISTSLMVAIVANEILFLSPQKSHIYFVLCKIIIIGLSLICSQILIFPSVVGIDPGWYRWFTLKILDNGYIPEGFGYSKLPLMSLMIGMTSLVTDLSYKMAAMFSISFIQVVCDVLFIFLLGKFLISTKIGLLATLLLEVANYHIWFSWWAIPNTMAATLIIPIIFILLKMRRDKLFLGTSLSLFLMGTLILTHTVTSMFLAILLFVFWLSFEVYTRLFHQETGCSVTWTICILFSTGMLAYWSYISGHIINIANLIKLGFFDPLKSGYPYIPNVPFGEQLFNNLGFFLFFTLSFIGCFYMISKQFRNSNRFIITIGGIIILSINFLSILVGKNIIMARWSYFSQIILAIPLSLSLILLNGIFKNHFIKGFLMTLSVFTLSFLLIMSPMANIDNFYFSPNTVIRYAFTESEMIGASFFARNSIGKISSDSRYIIGRSCSIFARYYNVSYDRILSLDKSLVSGNYIQDGSIKIIRREIIDRPFCLANDIHRIDYDPNIILTNSGFNKIYDSFSITAYR